MHVNHSYASIVNNKVRKMQKPGVSRVFYYLPLKRRRFSHFQVELHVHTNSICRIYFLDQYL